MVDVGAQTAGDGPAIRATAEIMKHLPCPHCGAQARLEAHSELRWVCGVCGGPRVPVEDAAAHSDRERQELVRAARAKKMAFTYQIAGIGLSLTGTLLALLGAALSLVSTAVAIVMMLGAAAALVAGVAYVRRANAQREEAKRAVFEAWESVAEALLHAHGNEMTADRIAREMHTSVDDVERMMSFLSVDNRARIVVKDAELVYSSGDVGAAETRIAEPLLESEEDDADAAHSAGADARRR